MNVSTTIPATVQIRRSRLLTLLAGIAVSAAFVSWAVSSYAVDNSSSQARTFAPAAPVISSAAIPQTGYLDAVEQPQSKWVKAVTSMSPVQLIEAFGTDTRTAVALAGLTPKERQSVESVITSTPAQLRAVFGTSRTSAPATPLITSMAIPPTGYLDAANSDSKWVQAVTSMSPVQLIEAFGTDTRTAVALAGLTARERQHVESIITSTPAQLTAAFGTSGR